MVQEISQGSAILSTRLSLCVFCRRGCKRASTARTPEAGHKCLTVTRKEQGTLNVPSLIIGRTHESGSLGRDYHLREGFAIAAG